MTTDGLILSARALGCSDVHIVFGETPIVRRNGELEKPFDTEAPYSEAMLDSACRELLAGTKTDISLLSEKDIDFCYQSSDGCRQRVNIYRVRGRKAVAIRLLNSHIPSFDELHLPDTLKRICDNKRGLILVTGPTGSGKSTTLAAMTDYINTTYTSHIITIEDPIEYVHENKRCLINQREVGVDTPSFDLALRSSLREDPDVILVGEMRDLDTISAALTAAETGHLVMATLHTIGAAKTIDRIIDVFPPHQQQQVRVQLAGVLRSVITQSLIPRSDGSGRVAAYEIMLVNDAVANLIRENKTFQINSVMQTNVKSGMISLDMHLARLAESGAISIENAYLASSNKEEFKRYAKL